MGAARSLRVQLLTQLVVLASAAVVLVGVITTLLAGADPGALAAPLMAFWAGSTAVLLVYGVTLLERQVLRPLRALAADADALEREGPRAPTTAYGTDEFAALAQRYRAMATSLLDARGEVVRAEKLAGIGRLAAGVAHEVRNPLGAIGTYAEVLRHRGADPAVLDEMRRAVDRIEHTVASLLEYARPQQGTGSAHAGLTASEVERFLRAQGALPGVRVVVAAEADVPAVRMERHALEQVFVNLLLNARDAGATLVRVEVTRQAAPDGALVVVADDGPGVPEADRERVFDPFFTTKDPGQGTGLGLAIVARAVHDAGGTIRVDRAREGGAAFRLTLPAGPAVTASCAS